MKKNLINTHKTLNSILPAYVQQTTSSYPGVATTPPCIDVMLSLHCYIKTRISRTTI